MAQDMKGGIDLYKLDRRIQEFTLLKTLADGVEKQRLSLILETLEVVRSECKEVDCGSCKKNK